MVLNHWSSKSLEVVIAPLHSMLFQYIYIIHGNPWTSPGKKTFTWVAQASARMVSTSWIMNLAVSWAPLLGKRPNMPLSIWRCQTQGGGGWWWYIYMYKLTYINDVCIYLTLFIYWFWFAPCWDLYIWIYFDIRGSIWVCQQWSGEPCSKSFVEWLWVYQNNMEHSLHHSIFQRIFRGWGDPWHNIFFFIQQL